MIVSHRRESLRLRLAGVLGRRHLRSRRSVPLIGAVTCIAMLCLGSSQASAASLLLNPKYVPRDFPINVVLNGPHGFHRVVHRRMVVQVPPGAVKVRVKAFTFSHPYRGVPAGSRAYPNGYAARGRIYPTRSQTFTRYPSNGEIDVAKIVYGTIRSARTAVLHAKPLSVTGPPSNPTALTLSPAQGRDVRVGQILAQAPSPTLPDGLLHRVAAIKRSGAGVSIALRPSSIWAAFPMLRIRERIPLSPGPGPSAVSGTAANPVALSFDPSLIASQLAPCGAGGTGWSFEPSGVFRPSLIFVLVRRFHAAPSGEIGLEVPGNLALDAAIPAAAHCDFTLNGPSLVSAADVAGMPVPIEGSFNLATSLQSNGPIGAQFQAELSPKEGMGFYGRQTNPIGGNVHPTASGTITTSSGELAVIPEIQAGFGAAGAEGHVALSATFWATETGNRCSVYFDVSGNAEADLGPYHLSQELKPTSRYGTPFNPQAPIYRCAQGTTPE